MATLQVALVAPDREVWIGEAQMVTARTTDGDIGVLPGHAPLLGILESAPVRIVRSAEDELVAAVHGGFLSVTDAGVSILGETVELAAEVDVPRARDALERAQGADQSDDEAVAAARRATARLRAAGDSG